MVVVIVVIKRNEVSTGADLVCWWSRISLLRFLKLIKDFNVALHFRETENGAHCRNIPFIENRIKGLAFFGGRAQKKNPAAISRVTERNYGTDTAIYHLQRLDEEEHSVRQAPRKSILSCSYFSEEVGGGWVATSQTIIDLKFSFSFLCACLNCVGWLKGRSIALLITFIIFIRCQR